MTEPLRGKFSSGYQPAQASVHVRLDEAYKCFAIQIWPNIIVSKNYFNWVNFIFFKNLDF